MGEPELIPSPPPRSAWPWVLAGAAGAGLVALTILAGCQTGSKRPTDAYDCVVTPADLVECNPVDEETET